MHEMFSVSRWKIANCCHMKFIVIYQNMLTLQWTSMLFLNIPRMQAGHLKKCFSSSLLCKQLCPPGERSHRHRHLCCSLSALCLVDFDQTYTDTLLGGRKEVIKTHFQGHTSTLKFSNFDPKKFVCTLSPESNDGFWPNFIYCIAGMV